MCVFPAFWTRVPVKPDKGGSSGHRKPRHISYFKAASRLSAPPHRKLKSQRGYSQITLFISWPEPTARLVVCRVKSEWTRHGLQNYFSTISSAHVHTPAVVLVL